MADVRCPMCGKPNPPELDTCQFCQARLKPLVVPEQSESAPQDQAPASDDSMSDWLSSLRDSGAHEDVEPAPEEDNQSLPMSSSEMPDWLDSLRGSSEEEISAFSAESTPEGSLSGGKTGGTDEEWPLAAELPDQEYVPAWLAQVELEQKPVDEPASPEAGEEGLAKEPEGEPEWLRIVRSKRQEDIVDSVPLEIPPAEAGLPEWLAQSNAGEPLESEASSDNVSGWLTKLRRGQALDEKVQEAGAGEEVTAPEESVEEPVQAGAAPAEPAEETTTAHAEEPAQEGEIPDWLAGLVAGKAVASAQENIETDAEGLPDWLADLDKSASQEPGVIVPFGEEEPGLTFDWLQEQVRADQGIPISAATGAGEPEELEAEKVGPFVGDLSDFLEEEYLTASETEGVSTAESGEDLAPAELPNWLEAMRPLGAAALGAAAMGDIEAQIESSGPLAGLRGVVPAEPDIARLMKPATYTIRLQVSDTQQANATKLEGLVKAEGVTRPVPGRPAITSQHVWRAIIFAVLIGVIFWKAFTGSQDIPLPALLPEVLDTSALIDGLPTNPVVLLAVDYEPGYAGEMEATSSALIDHLILKGAYLALVSTSPNGVALGEDLLQNISTLNGFRYQEITQYANLGYISGGSTGLLGFAEAPRQITPYAVDVNSTYVWGQAPMQRVQTISDFDLVAVLTEDADKARAWIEQVQPKMESKPLVMVLSAQAEPMVRPYYQSNPKLVAGMVAGLVGGGSYESAHPDLLGGIGPARRYWDAFSLSMLVVLVLIAVGIVVDLSFSAVKNRKGEEGGKAP
jgi:hypothetical protein